MGLAVAQIALSVLVSGSLTINREIAGMSDEGMTVRVESESGEHICDVDLDAEMVSLLIGDGISRALKAYLKEVRER